MTCELPARGTGAGFRAGRLRRAVFLASLVLLGLVLARVLARSPRASAAAEAVAPASLASAAGLVQEDTGALGYARRARVEPAPAAPSEGPSARSFLAEYYGPRWNEIEARMLAAGAWLDVPYTHHPWEEARAEIQARYVLTEEERSGQMQLKFDWPAELTVAWVREEFDTGRPYPLAEEDLPELEALVADLNLELLGKAELFTAIVDVSVQERFQRGQFTRAPYTDLGLNDERGFYGKAVAGLGWATSVVLQREDYPELMALDGELRALRQQRYERVVRHLHARLAR